MDIKIQTNINILPFGNINYTSRGRILLSSEQPKKKPTYQVPLTTDIESLEFDFIDETLLIPSATKEEPE